LAIINKNFGELDGEIVTKVFLGSNNRIAIIEGKLPYEGGYGALYYDSSGTKRIIIGIAPDGEIDIGVSIEGKDITTLYT
jgi:hypothetical protein